MPSERYPLSRRAAAEALGTALLLAVVVGSGIMADRLAGGNVAIALLANSLATGAGLIALIYSFGSISGAHFNPVVTLVEAGQNRIPWNEAPVYVLAQFVGALVGVAAAHLMFGEALYTFSNHVRTGPAQWFSEFIATFGLLIVIWGCARSRPEAIPVVVGGYIMAAYWFTASTSFANPAVTVARALTDTFTGIRPQDIYGFLAAQFIAAATATVLFRWFVPTRTPKKTIARAVPDAR